MGGVEILLRELVNFCQSKIGKIFGKDHRN